MDLLVRAMREFGDELPDGMAEAVGFDITKAPRSATPIQAGDGFAGQSYAAGILPQLLEGLTVKATTPPSDAVLVSPGSAYANGKRLILSKQVRLPIPITQDVNAQVFHVVMYGDEQPIVTKTFDRLTQARLAMIVAPFKDVKKIIDNRSTNPNTHDAYIVSGRDLLLSTGLEIDEYTEDALRNIVLKLRAEAIFGKLVVGDLLTVESSDGTIRLSDAIRIFDNDANLLALLSRDGLFFFTANGRPTARFTSEEGASRVGGLQITNQGDLQVLLGQSIRTAGGDVIINEAGIANGDDIPIAYVPTYYTRDDSIPEADEITDLSAHLDGISDQFERTKRTGLKTGVGPDLKQWNHGAAIWAVIYPTHQMHRIIKNPLTTRYRISQIDDTYAEDGDVIWLWFESGYNWSLAYESGGNVRPMGDSNAAGNEWWFRAGAECAQLRYFGGIWYQETMGTLTIHGQRWTSTYSVLASQSTTGDPDVASIGADELLGRNGAGAVDGQSPATVRAILNVTQDSEGVLRNQVTKTAAYTLTGTDYTVFCDTDTADVGFTITLPATGSHSGRIYCIKNTGTSGYNVTVDGDGAETIDGDLTVTLADKESITIQSDGTEWHII